MTRRCTFPLFFALALSFLIAACGLDSTALDESDGDADTRESERLLDNEQKDEPERNESDPDLTPQDGDLTPQDGDVTPEDGDQPPAGLKIYDLRNSQSAKHPPVGTTVSVANVVVLSSIFNVSNNLKGVFLSDLGGGPYAALLLTWKPTSSDAATGYDPPALEAGKVITVNGNYNEFCGVKAPYYSHCSTQIELTPYAKEKGSVKDTGTTAPLPQAVIALPAAVKTDGADSAKWQNALLAVDHVAVTTPADTYGVFSVTDDLAIDDTLYRYTAPTQGTEFDRILGFLYTSYDQVALLPRGADDLVLKGQLDGDIDPDGNLPDGDPDADTSTEVPQISVATFNVDRFFETNCDSGACGAGDYEAQPSQVAYNERAAQIAAAIDAINADVVILEEIEMQQGLDDINARTKSPYPIHELGETGTSKGTVDVGILARGSLQNVYHHYNEPMSTADGTSTHFARDFLELRIKIGGRSVIIFGAHFKSKNSDDAARRLAEAKTAAKILRQVALQNTQSLVVMGGDLNDTPDSEPVSALINDANLLRTAADCTGSSCATYYYSGQYQAIDHLLVSKDTQGLYVAHTTTSFRGGTGSNLGFAGSDHAALSATFTFSGGARTPSLF